MYSTPTSAPTSTPPPRSSTPTSALTPTPSAQGSPATPTSTGVLYLTPPNPNPRTRKGGPSQSSTPTSAPTSTPPPRSSTPTSALTPTPSAQGSPATPKSTGVLYLTPPNPNPRTRPSPLGDETRKRKESPQQETLSLPLSPSKKIKHLEAENASLRAEIQKLKKAATARDKVPKHKMLLQPHEGFESTLQKWVDALYKIIQPIVAYSPVGSNKSCNLVQERVKNSIRSLASFLYDIIGMGFCVGSETFKSENVVVSNGDIKFIELKLVTLTEKGIADNFKDLKLFIVQTFFDKREKDIPLDMERFLILLDTSADHRNDVVLIRHHYALMPGWARRNFICKCYEIINQYSDSEWKMYKQACGMLPHINSWTTLIQQTSPLYNVYTKGLSDNLYGSKHPTDQLRFSRNSLVHLLEHCRMGDPTRAPLFFYDDCEKMVFAALMETLSVFPEKLHQVRLLGDMRPEECFS